MSEGLNRVDLNLGSKTFEPFGSVSILPIFAFPLANGSEIGIQFRHTPICSELRVLASSRLSARLWGSQAP